MMRWSAPEPVLAKDEDTYRRLYVHGWAFALKALALAYYRVRIDQIGPLAAAIGADAGAGKTAEEAFKEAAVENLENWEETSPMTLAEFKERLEKIDWVRHRKHWIDITGYSEKDGSPRTFELKSGETVVVAQSPNTKAVISRVTDRILSDSWTTLCGKANAPVQ